MLILLSCQSVNLGTLHSDSWCHFTLLYYFAYCILNIIFHIAYYMQYCNCIVTRGGVSDEILPEPKGFPEGSGNVSSYTPTQITIQSFSITSTSQYFLVLTP